MQTADNYFAPMIKCYCCKRIKRKKNVEAYTFTTNSFYELATLLANNAKVLQECRIHNKIHHKVNISFPGMIKTGYFFEWTDAFFLYCFHANFIFYYF